MQKTHTSDEATLDGEITSQDSVSVSNTKLKNLIKSNLLRDQLLQVILLTSTPPPSAPVCPDLSRLRRGSVAIY